MLRKFVLKYKTKYKRGKVVGIYWKWFKSKSGIDDSKSQVDVSNISEDLTNDEYIFQEIVLRLLSPPEDSLNIKSLKTNLIRKLNKFIEENIYTLILYAHLNALCI